MNQLKLRPLPSLRLDETSKVQTQRRDGFVDDSVVTALLAGPTIQRQCAVQENLALAADDMDFAGWCLTETPSNQNTDFSGRRAAPPELDEPGLGTPHRGSHRWWLAGLAGALSTMLFSVLLITLASRTPWMPEDHPLTRIQNHARTQLPVKTDSSSSAPTLTGVSELK